MKVLSIILIIIGVVILVLAVGRLIAQQVILHKSRSINKVNEIVTFKLGGHAQKILLEGKNSSLPILITLHGGPEFPFFNGFGYRAVITFRVDIRRLPDESCTFCKINRALFDFIQSF